MGQLELEVLQHLPPVALAHADRRGDLPATLPANLDKLNISLGKLGYDLALVDDPWELLGFACLEGPDPLR